MASLVHRVRPDIAVKRAVRRSVPSLVRVEITAPLVALTFDDGPDPRLTPDVLDVLRDHGATATFLLVGERVREHPELARRVAQEGHEVGLHGHRHDDLRGTPFPELCRALRRSRRDVEAVVGAKVRWFRPPYGKQEPETVLACRVAGMRPVLWSTSGHDWELTSLQEQLAHVTAGVRPGSVVLLHDGAADAIDPPAPPPPFQPELLQQLLGVLSARGLRPVTVSDLVAAGRSVRAPWFEHWLHH